MKGERKINWEVVKVVSLAAVIVFLCILGAVSCSPRVYPQTEIKDSTVVIRERVVHDSVYFEVEKEVEKIVTRDTMSHLENKYGVSDAQVVDGFLYHSLESKPQRIYVPVEVTVHDTTTVVKQAETIVQKENYITHWQSFQMILGRILGGLLVLAGAAWAVKKFVLKR